MDLMTGDGNPTAVAGTITDLSDSGNAATIFGAPTWSGGAMVCDGSADYLRVDDSAELRFVAGTQDFFLAIWLERNRSGAAELLFDKRDGTNDGYQLHFRTDNKLRWFINVLTDTSTATITDTALHFIVFNVDRDGNASIWIDGVQDAGSIGAVGGEVMATTDPLFIGQSRGGTSMFQGDIYHVFVGAKLLSAGEIKSLYDQGPYRI